MAANPHGTIYWNQLNTWEPDQAVRFYSDVLGWTFDSYEMPDYPGRHYWIASAAGKRIAGIFPLSSPEFDAIPNRWVPYLAVDDVDARIRKAIRRGGKILRLPWDMPGLGRMAIVEDPAGGVMAWVTEVVLPGGP